MTVMKKIFAILLTVSLVLPFSTAITTVSAAENDVIKGNPVTITDPVTGCTYKYVNFDGKNLIRPYMGMSSWTSDGKSFLCGVNGTGGNGTLYLYNTETNEFTEIGPGGVHTHIEGVIGADDCVYYIRYYDIMKYDIKTGKNTVILPGSTGYSPGGITISNDGNYIVFGSKGHTDYYCEEGETGVFRYNIKTKEVECYGHKFPYSNLMNHFQINPEDPDIVFVCHEANIGDGEDQVPGYTYIYDREWAVDFKTGEFRNILKQGKRSDGQNILFTTHESWSASGKYLYVNCYSNASSNGKGGCIIRCYKDGSHREYLKGAHSNPNLSVDHAMASGDDKFTVVDSNQGKYVYLLSNDTYEQFPIYYSEYGFTDPETGYAKSHPYHPHPNVASNHYKVHWGIERDGVVGVAWYDFTNLAKKVAKGGRYPVNAYIDRVSYKGLDCESETTYVDGKEVSQASSGKYIYYDINEAVADGTYKTITLSFEYFDNSTNPLKLIYTDGVVNDNDLADSEDSSITINRNGTNKWKTKTVTIRGNFENVNPYRTDFKIGGTGNTYIANLQISEVPDDSKIYAGGNGTKENPYLISTPAQLKYFSHQVRTTTDKTEVDSNISYTATNSSNSSLTMTYSPKRYHVFSDKYFKLANDINMSGENWLPVGNLVNVFNGHFDGDGHVISNIYISGKSPSQHERYAFFGATGADVEIKNLGLENLVCQFAGSNNKFTVPEDASYEYYDRLIGAAGFVSLYAGGTFENCYLKNAEVRDFTEQMNSAGTGAFFGLGYGTVKATSDNGYNRMTVKNCYVNGATIRAHSNTYGFIGVNVKPNTTGELSDNDNYRVTKHLTNCYTANVRRGYYSDSLGKSNQNKPYDGGLYPFASTAKNVTYSNCYTTSKGERTTVSTNGTTYTYGTEELTDNGTRTTDIDTLTNGLTDNDNYYADVREINGGYPVHISVYDLPWDGKTDKKPSGEGTEENPYLISCEEELLWFKNSVNTVSEEGYTNGYTSCANAYFKLTNDIDLKGCEWEPVGTGNAVFNGHFDGNGHVIRNFHIINYNGGYNYVRVHMTPGDSSWTYLYTDKVHKYNGFFGITGANSVVENLGIENAKINFWNHDYHYNIRVGENNQYISSDSYRARNNGVMVGYTDGKFINCYVKNSEIKNMSRDIHDSGVGGFVGVAKATSSFEGCYVKDTKFTASYYSLLNGFVAKSEGNATFKNCYVAGVEENLDFASHIGKETTKYGFGYAGRSINEQNCISDMADYASQTDGSATYYTANSIGTTSADKDAIINTVASYEYLAPDNFDGNVNDGYPICLWQMTEKAKQKYDAESFDITTAITADLPTQIGKFGSTVTWTASDNSLIGADGVVTFYPDDKTATLYATTAAGFTTKNISVTVSGKVPFESYSFNVTKDGDSFNEFVTGGVLDSVSFYKNRIAEDCYMYTVLYDKTDGNRMIDCSVDFIDDSELSAKTTHTVNLTKPLKLSGNADKYMLKLIFIKDTNTLNPLCKFYQFGN